METTTQQLVHEINKAFLNKDTEAFLELLAPDAQWTITGGSKVIKGTHEIRRFFAEMQAAGPMPDLEIRNIVTEGPCAVVESIGTGTDAEGKPYRDAYCDIYHFSGGKLTAFTTYMGKAVV